MPRWSNITLPLSCNEYFHEYKGSSEGRSLRAAQAFMPDSADSFDAISSLGFQLSARQRAWLELRKVAIPDSRFHYDFSLFIADFFGSEQALARLITHNAYCQSEFVFVTSDNCLEKFRHQALSDKKYLLTTTFSLKRGFYLLDPHRIPESMYPFAATLDGMDHWGQAVTLDAIRHLPRIDFVATGTGAVNTQGVRLGNGSGYFDAAWAMLYRIGAVTCATPIASLVHDCQVLDEQLRPEIFDTAVDIVFTPTRQIDIQTPHKPTCGIVWDILAPHLYATIPPLRELKQLEPTLPTH